MSASGVIWHDLECGSYSEDLPLWRALAEHHAGPILDVGAGTGRVALMLAGDGHEVIALDRDAELLDALAERARARGLSTLRTVSADARAFALEEPVGLCIVPMQTVQLLDGPAERSALLACAARALAPQGRLALAIADALEPFEVAAGDPEPLPDVTEHDGTVYCSRPLAVRAQDGGFVIERRRETVAPEGTLVAETDLIRLARLDGDVLEAEGRAVGLRVAERGAVATTADYVGSTVVMFDG